jgi:hypothetical protein
MSGNNTPWGEEYLPTIYHDKIGREYVIHCTVSVMVDVGRRYNLTLQDLASPDSLPMHVLLGVAEIGTRYMTVAKHFQTEEDWLTNLGDVGSIEALEAARNAIINFTLRGNRKLSSEDKQRIKQQLIESNKLVEDLQAKMMMDKLAEAEALRAELSQSLTDGNGSTSSSSPPSQA